MMDTIKFDKKTVKMVAHRGLSGIERENTASAFVAAGNRSYYGIETDISPTTDGNFICLHNDTMEYVSGENIEQRKCSLATYQSVVLYDVDKTKSRTDLRVPTLQNYISICKKYGKVAVCELKHLFTQEQIDAVLEICRELGYLDKVTFIAFDFDNLVMIRKREPSQPVQFLTYEYSEELAMRLVEHKFDLDIHHVCLNAENVRRLHDLGIKVNCWTVDTPERAAELASFGVDYITSNICE